MARRITCACAFLVCLWACTMSYKTLMVNDCNVLFVNPRRACAARGMSVRRPSVLPSVCYHAFCHYAQQGGKNAIPTGSVPHWLDFKIAIYVLVVLYCVQKLWRETSQYANEHGLPVLDQILPVSSTMEAVEVTRRASMWSWFGKNTTYRRS